MSNISSSTASWAHRMASGHVRRAGPVSLPSITCRSSVRPGPAGSAVNVCVPSTPTSGRNVNSTSRPGTYRVTR